MEKSGAIELAERWLRASGQRVGESDGVRVEHERVSRVPEGWFVPYGNVAFLDHGDPGKEIFPPPALIVTEPEGQVRFANTTPRPGFSKPVVWPGEQAYAEIVDPEYQAAELFELGVPRVKIAGWEIQHPDGRKEGKANPAYKPGPLRCGFPRHHNKLEALLNHHELKQLDREKFLAGLYGTEVLVPLQLGSEELHSDAHSFSQHGTEAIRVYSSPQRIPSALRWWRMKVATFAQRYPTATMVINDGSYPSQKVTAAELAELPTKYRVFASSQAYLPAEPTIETEPGFDGSLDDHARALQQQFGLPTPPTLSRQKVADARESGFNLTLDERAKLLTAEAWKTRNSRGYQVLPSAGDDLSAETWPTDLRANGLMSLHDQAGRVWPAVETFGKYPRMGGTDPHTSWHSVVGAFVGFAIGDALGTAVDGLSWAEIQQRFGPAGITDLQVVFERPGQVSWRTQLMMFLTEGAIRGSAGKNGDSAMRSAHARFLVTQGVPWQQAAGTLAAEHPEPDGWLVRVPELHAQRGVPPQLVEAVRAAVAEPGGDHGLFGPMMLAWGLPGALARNGFPTGGWRRTPDDLVATAVLEQLLSRLFLRQKAGNAVCIRVLDLLEGPYATPATPPEQQARDLLRDVHKRWFKFLQHDITEIEQIGGGVDTFSVLGRAVFAAARREYDPRTALTVAVNHSGRSAMTGALAGAMVGARAGIAGLPREWVEALDVGEVIRELADEAYWNFAQRNPYEESDDWAGRYPNW